MLSLRPDFYDDFRCRASGCRHSCCVGWEIDVDSETLAWYRSIPGEIGASLREMIELSPTPHFRLTEGERCPFLRDDGLCRLILTLGEDGLCDICAEHPRFYNEYPGRLEMGLGLCCEEAARLLLAGTGHLRLIAESDGETETPDALLLLRGEVFRLLAGEESMTVRMEKAMALLDAALPAFDVRDAVRFCLTLERMDESWTALLTRLATSPPMEPEPRLSEIRFARIAEYLVYRHFASAPTRREAALRLSFCFFSVRLLCALEALAPLDDALRLFSAEIEYSDENVEKLCAWLGDKLT